MIGLYKNMQTSRLQTPKERRTPFQRESNVLEKGPTCSKKQDILIDRFSIAKFIALDRIAPLIKPDWIARCCY